MRQLAWNAYVCVQTSPQLLALILYTRRRAEKAQVDPRAPVSPLRLWTIPLGGVYDTYRHSACLQFQCCLPHVVEHWWTPWKHSCHWGRAIDKYQLVLNVLPIYFIENTQTSKHYSGLNLKKVQISSGHQHAYALLNTAYSRYCKLYFATKINAFYYYYCNYW